jgi:hypothetical protein
VSIGVLTLLTGCASDPSVNNGSSPEEYAKNMFAKGYDFLLKNKGDPVLVSSLSGVPDDKYGIVGLRVAFEPFE